LREDRGARPGSPGRGAPGPSLERSPPRPRLAGTGPSPNETARGSPASSGSVRQRPPSSSSRSPRDGSDRMVLKDGGRRIVGSQIVFPGSGTGRNPLVLRSDPPIGIVANARGSSLRGDGDRQPLPSLSTAATQNGAPGFRAHPLAESVRPLSTHIAWLIRSLHKSVRFCPKKAGRFKHSGARVSRRFRLARSIARQVRTGNEYKRSPPVPWLVSRRLLGPGPRWCVSRRLPVSASRAARLPAARATRPLENEYPSRSVRRSRRTASEFFFFTRGALHFFSRIA